ncbi:uncharacterized protein At4g38062 [Spinacia oleracea]|uniref:Uncharacterized protein At4g38062 n=1 Tax=Spinacia oleracea TaxID=3562 RepID=A0A9R0JDJ6_SPIOL|nr:uncharacterized protein At4g38062-like [Spinacia oleracea]
MEIELQEAKAEIERLNCNLDDKDYIIKSQYDENEALKAIVSELKKKNINAKKDINQCEGQGGNLLEELVDRQRKVEDELKWKVEQFKHLEEAYEKLRDQFRVSKTEWGSEKSSLVDEISKLQESLDEGNRTAEGLRNQLAMCKQALENEEIRRKKFEEQVCEMKSLLESVTQNEGFEGKECSVAENGEEEVANLRHTLRVKEMDYKDMEYRVKKLERENEELLASIKELQEAHIPRAVPTPSSWAKLKNRLKSLELSHRECSANLRVKEAEWSYKADKMNQVIEDLRKELEGCNSTLTQLKMQNEELSLMLQLMRSEGLEDREGGVAQLMEQLEKIREEKLAMQEDLEKLREELEDVCDALDKIDSELTDQTNEKSELEFELQNWISIAAHLEMQVTGSQVMRRDLEYSLIEQAEVEEMLKLKISNLEQQIFLMDQEIRIEEDVTTEEDEKVSPRLEIDDYDDDDEELQQELLARELEEAIVGHIMEEKNYTFLHQSLQEDDMGPSQKHERIIVQTRINLQGEEVCASKENVRQQHSHLRKTSDSLIEERSPFRELN